MQRKSTTLPVIQITVGTGNWDVTRKPISKIIIHTIVGTITGASARFAKVNEKASAHYGVALDGKLYQWVDEDKTAYHAGNYAINQESIGIEHEDGTNPQTNPDAFDKPRPDVLYATSIKLVADLCTFYSIPVDRAHILRHNEISATHCPGTLDIDRIINEAKKLVVPSVNTNPEYVKTLEVDRITFWRERDEEIKKNVELREKLTQAESKLSAFAAKGFVAPEDVDKLKEEYARIKDGLDNQIVQLLKRTESQSLAVAEKDREDATAIDEGRKATYVAKDLTEKVVGVTGALQLPPDADAPTILDAITELMLLAQDRIKKSAMKKTEFKPGPGGPTVQGKESASKFWTDILKTFGFTACFVVAVIGLLQMFH